MSKKSKKSKRNKKENKGEAHEITDVSEEKTEKNWSVKVIKNGSYIKEEELVENKLKFSYNLNTNLNQYWDTFFPNDELPLSAGSPL